MGCSELLRMIGIVNHFVCVILFLVAMGTVNWMNVKHFSGKAGLWRYCNFHKNDSLLEETSPAPSILPTTLSTTTTTATDDESEEKEKDECHSFGVIDIDSYLLIVRMLIILALFCFAYGFFKGTTIRVKIEYNPNFIRQHTGELLSLMGAILGMLAERIYAASFKSDGTFEPYLKRLRGPNGEEDDDLLELGWSAGLLEGAMIALFPAVILMLMPTLNDKCGWCHSHGQRSTVRSQALCRNFRSNPRETILRYVTCHRFNPPASSNAEVNIREVELATRRQSEASSISDGSIFTISDSRTDRVGDNSEPAPRYEDLSPLPPTAPLSSDSNTLMPPPPSYDDVLKGLYAITPPSGAPTLLPPPYTDSPPPAVSSTSVRPVSSSSSSQEESRSRNSTPLPDHLAQASPSHDRFVASSTSHAPIAHQESIMMDDMVAVSDTASVASSSTSDESSSSDVTRPRSRSASIVSQTRWGSRSSS